MLNDILIALAETCFMVFSAGFFALIGGLPLGVVLSLSQKNKLWENLLLYRILSILTNATRSIPFIILMIAMIPFTRWLTGSSIQVKALIVPLSVAAIPFFARTVETAINEVSPGLIEATQSMGATSLQIIYKVLLPEAAPGLINGLTLTLVNLVGFSAIAGFNGSGGLGKLAIDYGFYRYNTPVVLMTIALMILLVQCIQSLGDHLARKIFTA